MRQKEVMGQSIRTSKSARPGTITYVPIDKSEFRSTVSSDKKKNKIMKIGVMSDTHGSLPYFEKALDLLKVLNLFIL